ncbi:GH18 domain-containing protein [Caenorhabditis elegans]|uniref:GH18 domain-containing protein n=1 Tax=Caenorhabditis elegans TaxID=6239 RepID=Q21866_CAEEL|nr:GH18 domain-containing protein [Caenorhabditis elegans]CAA93870.2 GH18 domain-containing protein [Caenorhabditis elegans]|eukprot:NP_496031.2 CHItinase-Like [Caenorhabditis elegans]
MKYQSNPNNPLLKEPKFKQKNDKPVRNDAAFYNAWKYVFLVVIFSGVLAFGICFLLRNYGVGRENREFQTMSEEDGEICDKKVIGYFSESHTSEITINHISKLTHAVFAFVIMKSDGTVMFRDKLAQERFLKIRDIANQASPKLKMLISIGGPANSDNFLPVISSPDRKKIFINSIVSFLKKYDIDGVDLFWKWPRLEDKYYYSRFISMLKERFQMEEKNYILSIIIPPCGFGGWNNKFDIENIVAVADFINIYSMDYYGPWKNPYGNPTGPISPIYNGAQGREAYNVHSSALTYSCKVKQSKKFNIVIPFFARLWKNVEKPIQHPGREVYRNVHLVHGSAVGESFMSRKSVLEKGYKLNSYSYDELSRSAFIYNSTTKEYLTFETEKSIEAKVNYVKDRALAGVWIWFVDLDDEENSLINAVNFTGLCSSGDTLKFDCHQKKSKSFAYL